jgi:hypothetical protein
MNDNTRTATVYTSDLSQRIKKSTPSTAAMNTRAMTQSAMSQYGVQG